MMHLRAGTSVVDITPRTGCHICGGWTDRRAELVHDPLHATSIVMDNGETTLGVVVCDLIAVPDSLVVRSKAMIQDETGVPPENVLICATHTHSGPAIIEALGTPLEEGYGESITAPIAQSFAQAVQKMVLAQAAHAGGTCREEVHNRRRRMRDGSVRTNPGHLNAEAVEPAGPTDPRLVLLILRAPGGQPLAVVANLALHYVGTSEDAVISADYFGAFAASLRRCAGADFPVVMTNGCSGDINNLDFSRAPRRPTSDQLAVARRLLPKEDRTDREWIYAREVVLMERESEDRAAPLQALRIGDLGIAGLPGEPFVQIGLDITQRSPFSRTATVGLANSYRGYVATDEALAEGSYETRLCRHSRASEGTRALWAGTSVRFLQAVRGG